MNLPTQAAIVPLSSIEKIRARFGRNPLWTKIAGFPLRRAQSAPKPRQARSRRTAAALASPAPFGLLVLGLAGALAVLPSLPLPIPTGPDQAWAGNESGDAAGAAATACPKKEISAQNQGALAPTPPEEPGINLPAREVIVPLEQIKDICARFGLETLWAKIAKDPPVRPFKSDGCSLWFNKWQGYDLYPACFRHDLKYWAGYPGEAVDRLVADSELMIEVARIMGSTKMAETMFAGVRVGGGSWTRASFAWGFGRIRP